MDSGIGQCWAHPSIYALKRYELTTYYMPGTVLDSRDFSSEGNNFNAIIFQLGIGQMTNK